MKVPDLEDYHPSVLLHCWLGHLTCKIVSEMTYNVLSWTLNPTIPYNTILTCFDETESDDDCGEGDGGHQQDDGDDDEVTFKAGPATTLRPVADGRVRGWRLDAQLRVVRLGGGAVVDRDRAVDDGRLVDGVRRDDHAVLSFAAHRVSRIALRRRRHGRQSLTDGFVGPHADG